jgi:hypothetical protein
VRGAFHPAWNFLIKPGGLRGYEEGLGLFWGGGGEGMKQEREESTSLIHCWKQDTADKEDGVQKIVAVEKR